MKELKILAIVVFLLPLFTSELSLLPIRRCTRM